MSSLEQFAGDRLDQFLRADVATALRLRFGEQTLRDCLDERAEWLIEQIDRDIADIDAVVESQLNAILHSPPFQRLEASWRGIEYLTEKLDDFRSADIKISLLNVSWSELYLDFESVNEFDQSLFFKQVYEGGIGQAGSYPFSVILADYFIHPMLEKDYPYDDIDILRNLAQVAAAAFCPIIANVHPSMFSVDHFADLRNSVDLDALHSSPDFFQWRRFRELEDSRFVCLALPKMLMRRPYRETLDQGFPFNETIVRTEDYLWGGAAFGMGEVLMRAFAESGWFTNIRGAQRGIESGGVVIGPAKDPFDTEPHEYAPRPLTDFVLTDHFDRILSNAGFLPLCASKEMSSAVFYSTASTQKTKEYDQLEATMNARLSSMLNYILCVSRFAHYLKLIARDKIGGSSTPQELEMKLQQWIVKYVTPDREASFETRLRKPLLEAEVKVRAVPGQAGEYKSFFYLVPHHELDDMRVAVRLETKFLITGS